LDHGPTSAETKTMRKGLAALLLSLVKLAVSFFTTPCCVDLWRNLKHLDRRWPCAMDRPTNGLMPSENRQISGFGVGRLRFGRTAWQDAIDGTTIATATVVSCVVSWQCQGNQEHGAFRSKTPSTQSSESALLIPI